MSDSSSDSDDSLFNYGAPPIGSTNIDEEASQEASQQSRDDEELDSEQKDIDLELDIEKYNRKRSRLSKLYDDKDVEEEGNERKKRRKKNQQLTRKEEIRRIIEDRERKKKLQAGILVDDDEEEERSILPGRNTDYDDDDGVEILNMTTRSHGDSPVYVPRVKTAAQLAMQQANMQARKERVDDMRHNKELEKAGRKNVKILKLKDTDERDDDVMIVNSKELKWSWKENDKTVELVIKVNMKKSVSDVLNTLIDKKDWNVESTDIRVMYDNEPVLHSTVFATLSGLRRHDRFHLDIPTIAFTKTSTVASGPKLKISFKGRKDKEAYDFRFFPDDLVSKMIDEVAKKNNVDPSKIVLSFDGEKLDPALTLNDCDLEDDEMVEVRIK